jgi:PAS domain S-box-containing protein
MFSRNRPQNKPNFLRRIKIKLGSKKNGTLNRKTQLFYDLEYIIAHIPGFVYWKDLNSRYMGCNNNLARISNLKDRSEIVGKTDHDFGWGAKQAQQFVKDDQYIIKTKENLITEYELPIKREDGHYFWVRTEKMPFFDHNGEVIGILAIASDITDQKLAEKETHIAHTLLQDIIYNLPGLIYWKNKKSQYAGFNKNVLSLSGLSREELLSKTDKELNWGEKEAESFQKDDQEVMENGVVKITEHEIPIKRADGRCIIVRTEKSRLYDRKGNVAGVLGVAMDVTDQKILQSQLKEQIDKAEIANRVKTQFIENMEHDIRTPFCGVYGLADILFAKETDPEKKSILGDISVSAKELYDYCNSILDFSTVETGHLPIVEKEFDVRELTTSVIKMETLAANLQKLKLLFNYDNNIPSKLLGDEYRLKRILINLISNAIKFTKKGFI